jgi:ABC-type xylose transport system permease subunit
MSTDEARRPVARLPQFVRRLDPAVATAFACILLLLFLGSLYSTSFLSPDYLLQQLKVASFLGVIATGMMLVVLLGQIDLSVPWVVAVGGMMAAAATVSFGYIVAFAAADAEISSSVYPSAAERTTASVPRLVFAPGRFSITKG